MKRKDIRELHTKDMVELRVLLAGIKEEQFKNKMDQAQHKLKNTRSLFMKRKDVARILSVIQEKGASK